MASEAGAGESQAGEGKQGQSPWLELLRDAGSRLLPIVISSAGLIGFVAFAGGVSVWSRFSAAQVPPDQAVAVLPRGELVAIGAALLLLFGFFGALAVIGVFLIDRSGRATPGMARALLLLLMVEGVAVIVLADDTSMSQSLLAALLFLFPLCVIFWMTFLERMVGFSDEHPPREGETAPPKSRRGLLRPGESGEVPTWAGWALRATVVIPLVTAAVAVGLLVLDASDVLALVVLGALAAVFAGLVLPLWYFDSKLVDRQRETEAQEKKDDEETEREEEEGELLTRLRLLMPEEREKREERLRTAREKARLAQSRPYRLTFHGLGIGGMLLAIGFAVALPAWALHEWWLAGSVAAAAVLAVWVWRVAILSKDKILWFGLAVFISVPLFGTISAMIRNLDDPQVQPMALIRKTDGAGEAIQGLYVTEADERVYFATVATEGCGHRIVRDSGRLLWIPKSELVAMAVGPLQSVEDAATTSLEMAQTLASKVDAPLIGKIGGTVSLRLEHTGSAVRPRFGSGVRLVPEEAKPGSVVSLRLSASERYDDIAGFGESREGRLLRVGEVPAPIIREKALVSREAEFVKTVDGRVLALDGNGVYTLAGDSFIPFRSPLNGRRRFVKLDTSEDPSIAGPGTFPSHTFLELDQSGAPRLAARQSALVGADEVVPLEPRLLREAWHESEIKFRVPENALSGVVSVECRPLATEPVLRVP